MQIPLIEPTSTRYIHVNPATNRVHLLVPFIGGQDISTDNTCKANVEVDAFFGGGAFQELEAYRSVLEFHISLLEEGDEARCTKAERLAQINTYLEAVGAMREGYHTTVNAFLAKPSNLYSIQLRPKEQDPVSQVVNPVFTVNRQNDSGGNPLSPLYNQMHTVFPELRLGKPDPRTELTTAVLSALPKNAAFEVIQRVLTEQCQSLFGAPVDFQNYIKHTPGRASENQTVDKAHIDALMGFGADASSEDYIDALLGCCAQSLWTTLEGSPFYLGIYALPAEKAERLSIMTQFYLGVLNVYCRAQGISDNNFGEVLDNDATLSQALVEAVSHALKNAEDVEAAVVGFFNKYQAVFGLSRELTPADKAAIQQKFEVTWRTVTATKENPHMDDFMILDTEARGETDLFFTQGGLICTDFSNIISTGPHQAYFDEIRQEASTHPDVMRPQDEAPVIVDIEPEALIKISDIQWDKLPKEVADACRALPAFQLRQFPDAVAKGKQDDAEAILNASDDKQMLLTTPAKFTDYSGRTFNCTAYEYAYWAKDKHMCRMLERHMDDDTKALLLDKVNEMEQGGLTYQQHGRDYKNPHYDMSFVLKDLTTYEFHQLQTMVGQTVDKIQQATADNYQTLAFTADEYEALKKALESHKQWRITSFFYTSTPNAISNKLKFDFNSLITALDTYVTSCDRWSLHQQIEAWMNVGKAQRDVPAHIAHEYCRTDRSFNPLPSFNEDNLPRILTFYNDTNSPDNSWFPLSLSTSGLGFNFGLIRGPDRVRCPWERRRGHVSFDWVCRRGEASPAIFDLAAVRRLDEVRVNDLTQSRDNLSRPASQLGLAH